MITRTRTLTEKITFEDNKTKAINLPRDAYISRIDLIAKFTIKTNASTTPVYNDDDVLRLIKNIRIVSGSTPFVDAPGRWLYYKAYYEFPKEPRKDSVPTETNKTQDVYVVIPIHFGVAPNNKYDPTCVLAAREKSSLYLEVLFGGIDDLASAGVDDVSGEIEVTLHELLKAPRRIIEPEIFIADKAIDAAYSGYGFTVNLQHDKTVRRVFMFVTDSSPAVDGTKSDDIVSAFKLVQTTPQLVEVLVQSWVAEKEDDRMRYNKAPPTGVAVIDAEEIVGRILMYTGKREGQLQLQMTTTGSGGLSLLYHGFKI